MARKIPERGPALVAWAATMLALVHREGPMLTTKTPNDRRETLKAFAFVADDVVDLFLERVETEAEYDKRRALERDAERKASDAST